MASSGILFPLLVVSIITLSHFGYQSQGAMLYASPPCSPERLEVAPPRVRNLCETLLTMYQPRQLEAYDDNLGRSNLLEALSNAGPIVGGGVKRQDVDHIFLRFGRRR